MSTHFLVECLNSERGETAALLLAMCDERKLPRSLVKRHVKGYLAPVQLMHELVADAAAAAAPVHHGEENLVAAVAVIAEAVEPDRETVRAWAKANGLQVAEKGQLKKSIYEAYAVALVSSGETKTED
jgi:hypothetical protein